MTANGGVVLLAGLGAGAMWGIGYPGAAVVAVAAGLLLAWSAAWWWLVPRRCEPRLSAAPAEVNRGDDVTVRLGARSGSRWSRGPVLARLDLFGESTVEFISTAAGSATAADADVARVVQAHRRGQHGARLSDLVRCGPLGLVRRRLPGSAEAPITVLPRLHAFTVPTPMGNSDTDDGVTARGARGGRVFSTLRDYQPGDDIRLIHWAASARTADDRLLVRQNLQSRAIRLTVILDPQVDLTADDEHFETCVDIAYSLIEATRRHRGRPQLTLLTLMDHTVVRVRGPAEIRRTLLGVEAVREPPSRPEQSCLATLLRDNRGRGRASAGELVVIVSAAGLPPADQQRMTRLLLSRAAVRTVLLRVGGAPTADRVRQRGLAVSHASDLAGAERALAIGLA